MRLFTSLGTLVVLLVAGFFTILADVFAELLSSIRKIDTSSPGASGA